MSEEATIAQEIDYAKAIFHHNQDLVNFVDAKAGVILAVDGAILAILSGSSAATRGLLEQLLFGAGVLLIGISALLGFLIIKPRLNEHIPTTKIFFRAIVAKSKQDYKESFPSTTKEILDDYLNNIYALALIQKKKFSYLEVSLYSLLLGLIPIVATMISLRA